MTAKWQERICTAFYFLLLFGLLAAVCVTGNKAPAWGPCTQGQRAR